MHDELISLSSSEAKDTPDLKQSFPNYIFTSSAFEIE